MAVILLVLWLFVGLIFQPAEAQGGYANLPDVYRKGVNLALQQINSHVSIQNHFLFFGSKEKTENEEGFRVSYIYHHFFLKATRCAKGTPNPDPKQCPFRTDRPLIDCAVCFKTFKGNIEKDPKPYVHCVHKPTLTEDMLAKRTSHCANMKYTSGSATLLSSRQ